jgi:hypothetical protein
MYAWNTMDKNIVVPTFGPDLTSIVECDPATMRYIPSGIKCMARVDSGYSRWGTKRCSFTAKEFTLDGFGSYAVVKAFCKIHDPVAKEEKYQAARQKERDEYERLVASRKATNEKYAQEILECTDIDAARELVTRIISTGTSRGMRMR